MPTSRFVCVLVFSWPINLLGGVTLRCSRSCLAIVRDVCDSDRLLSWLRAESLIVYDIFVRLPVLLWFVVAWFKGWTVPWWRIATKELLMIALISFDTASHEGRFMSKTADLWFLVEGLGVLVPMPDCFGPLDRWLGLLLYHPQENVWRPLACIVFPCWGTVDWSFIHLEDPFFSICFSYGKGYWSGRQSCAWG